MDANIVVLPDLPVWALVGLGLLALVQVSVEVIALVVLIKTPGDRLMLGKKWPWVLVILFVNLIGALIFLAAGRKPASAEDPFRTCPTSENTGKRGQDVANVLYGSEVKTDTGSGEDEV